MMGLKKLDPTFIQLLEINNYKHYTTNTTIYYIIYISFFYWLICLNQNFSCFSWRESPNSDFLKLEESWSQLGSWTIQIGPCKNMRQNPFRYMHLSSLLSQGITKVRRLIQQPKRSTLTRILSEVKRKPYDPIQLNQFVSFW